MISILPLLEHAWGCSSSADTQPYSQMAMLKDKLPSRHTALLTSSHAQGRSSSADT